ncbi:hypothetical protein [Luteithermobacter gelatinilyticus]|uniref:hypothetical protein n=1 Tax=Luteithermobacter gelatinilyticus TaxID=2582913 RepID=UPI0011070894|nr:hypothetical protein [Luteithermobacter gelatinilyticus]
MIIKTALKLSLKLSGIILLLIYHSAALAQPPLSGDKIEGFISTLPKLEELGEKYDIEDDQEDLDSQASPDGAFSPFTSSLRTLKGHKAYNDFMAIIREAGFSSAEEWAMVGDRVMRAFISTEIKGQHSSSRAEMEEAIKDVQNNPHISTEQKQAIINNLHQSMAMMSAASNAPAEDVKAIQPYLGKLKSLSKETQ